MSTTKWTKAASAAMAGGTQSTTIPTARVKRRKTTIPAVNKQDELQTTIIDALQIVQNQTILNATQMNTNLQQLSNEINEIYNHDDDSQSIKEWRKDLRLLATNIDVTIQKYKERRSQNTLVEEGDHIKNNSWCPRLDAYVYDPHVRGKAAFYDKCKCTNFRCPRSDDDGALFPATARPLGDEALIVLLGNKEVMKEDSLLRMRNNYLCAKVDNQIRQLYVRFKSENTFLNKGIPAFIAGEDSDDDIVEEEEDTMQGAVNVSLSEADDGNSDEEETGDDVLDEEAINVDEIVDSDVEAMIDFAVAPPGYEGYHVSSSSGSVDENESQGEEDEEEESVDDDEEEEEGEEGNGFIDANRVEIDFTISERLEELLSKLSSEDLLQHVAAYNIDLRKDIADTTAFIGNLEQRWRFTPNEFYLYVANNLANRRLSKSIQDLPGKVDIVFDPLQEVENRFLCEKLEGLFILLMRAVFDKELFDDQYAELFEEEPICNFRFFFEFPGFL